MGNGNGWLDPVTNPYYNPYAEAGEEISSTFEGRHILVQEEYLIHIEHDSGDDLVRKGDPILTYGMGAVGIALQTATSLGQPIPIDTEGIWRVSVTVYYGIYVGQPVFIGLDGVVSDDPDVACTVFGYALQDVPTVVDGPDVVIIAVKVHWMMPWWWFIP